MKIDLSKFTLVAATTRLGLLTTPLRDRFGIPVRLAFYTVDELELIVRRGARLMGLNMTDEGAREVARRARGTPRIAGRLLRRVRDFAEVARAEAVTREIADEALTRLLVDKMGLDQLDMRYLTMIAVNFGGGPVGIETIAAGLGAARCDRGHHRALYDPAGFHPAHTARAHSDCNSLETSGHAAAQGYRGGAVPSDA